jgi:GTP cyclohydrolase II
MQQCERAIFDLRRGIAVVVLAEDGDRIVAPLETATEETRELLASSGEQPARLVLARERLAALGYADPPEAGSLPAPSDAEKLARLAWGSPGVSSHAEAPLTQASHAERAAVALLKRALTIPAALCAPVAAAERDRLVEQRTVLDVTATEIDRSATDSAVRVHQVSAADVPLQNAPATRFILFREPDGLREHVAVRIGDPSTWPEAVPVRLHSACLTGDLFGSLRCDCGEQLRTSVERIAEAGGGVLLYLAQEGRGIGLANKLRAYELQDRGADTVEADARLGFAEDERHFDVAVEMLQELGLKRIRLLTNNPAKIAAIESGGIEISDRQELYGALNEHNERYLRAKADRSGHLLGEWLETESAAD